MKYFRGLALLVAFSVSAVECSITAEKPWEAVGGNAWRVAVDGSRSYPKLKVQPKTLKENTYYIFSFQVVESKLGFSGFHQNKSGIKGYYDDLETQGPTKYYSYYFRTDSEKNSIFGIYPLPGKEGKGTVCNISLKEVTDFSRNLLREGDFESGSALFPRHEKYAGQLTIVNSAGFFCGEKSLQMTKKANDTVAAITRDLPAIPGKTVKVRFWAKTERDTVAGILYLDFFRSGHKEHLLRNFGFKIEPEWKEFVYTYVVPEDTERYPALTEGMLRVQFHLPKSESEAMVYLDNLEYSVE